MDAAERTLLEEAVGGALRTGAGGDAALAGVGWLEMLEAEPTDAIGIVFDALGRTGAVATALDDVVIAALGLAPRADLAVLLPRFGSWDPPSGVGAAVIGLATGRVVGARELLVVHGADNRLRAAVVPASAAELQAVHGLDPDAGFHRVHAAAPGDSAPIDPAAWDAAVGAGRRAVAQQIAGASRTMLALACTHAMERVQFGRRIASFQAVRHRLADALVAVEALDATLAAAADEQTALTAELAKATAGRTARTVAAHCQQVLAGIGFTTDHPFHRFVKRTMVLDGVFGNSDDLALDIGRQLLAVRRVPTLVEL
jgi:hypothetical protein